MIRDTFKQQRDSYDFVVRVEDFRGNMVKERVWKDIVPLAIEQLPVSLNNLSDPEELSPGRSHCEVRQAIFVGRG